MDEEANYDWEDLQRHFRAALSQSPEDRPDYLKANCPDEGMRKEVFELLQAFDSSEYLLGSSLVSSGDAFTSGTLPTVDGFQIGRELGRGGMGIVYEALQLNPHRSVALKVLAGGLSSNSTASRFERESELLARLQHTGIAQIYGAGVAEVGGRPMPYFAMELVEGRSLLKFASEEQLGATARLNLIAQICDAVQHAHQRGVIHRDLKPSNILVTAQGQTKILDFGVARNTGSDLLCTTLQTNVGQLIGTLPYMSPEQTIGDPDCLDTRSDVYALGVVCYELLAGQLPYKIQSQQLVEAVHTIQSQDPRPLRDTSPSLKGDVETIVGKALEKDPDRRYDAASELAADIRRFLSNEPIEARPASRLYQLQKFSQRHRGLVVSVLLLVFILTVAVALTTKLALDRKLALVTATDAQATALRREANAQSVLRFLEVDVLGQASPYVPVDRNLTLAEALTNAAAALDGRFLDEPEIEYSLRMTLAKTLDELSHYEAAERQALRANELAELCFGELSAECRAAERLLGSVESHLGRYGPAATRLQEVLEKETRNLSRGHPDRIRTLVLLGSVLKGKQDREAAATHLLEALDLANDEPAIDQRERWRMQQLLGSTRRSQGRYLEARELLETVMGEQVASLGANHPGTLITENSLAILLKDAGENEAAAELCLDLIPRCEEVFGQLHASTLSCKTILAGAYQNLGRFEDAHKVELGNLADLEATLGPNSVEAWKTRGQIADSLLRLDRLAEAKQYATEALDGLLGTVGEEHSFTLLAVGRMGSVYQVENKLSAAAEMFERAMAVSTELFGPDHTQTATFYHNLAAVLESQGDLEGAAELFREAADVNAGQLGENHPNVLTSLNSLAGIHVRRGELSDAEALYSRVIDGFEIAVGPDYWIRGSALLNYSECLRRAGRPEEALSTAEEAVDIIEQNFGPEHQRTKQAKAHLQLVKKLAG